MTTSFVRSLPTAALLTLLASPAALALVPAPDLPPGTFHELRINSITALTIAQQITQASVCSNPNTCLHNEIRVGVSIDFASGTIAIDARAPEDENGIPVLPGLPGGVLFNTLSGPAEMSFAEPCENPDGCPLGEALYIGTIDQGGNVSFPSLGINFELFGVSPISKFRGPMGTGASTDPADPGEVAQGEPLDFTTGALHLAGIDFIPAPIVGTTLQLDRIRGTLVPVPIPPVETKDLLRCQRAVEKAAATLSKARQGAVQRCVDAQLLCEISQETGGSSPDCLARATTICDGAEIQAIRAEESLSRQIVRGCAKVGPANMIAVEGGLGLGLVKPQCDSFGISTATRESIALCLGKVFACATDEIVARLQPRAFEVLAARGYDTMVPPDGCVVPLPAGDATGASAPALLRCQTAIGKQGAKYGKIKQLELQACLSANLTCHLPFEHDTPGSLDPECVDRAVDRCNKAVVKIASAETKKIQSIQRACAPLDTAGIPQILQGLGFGNLSDHCGSLDPAVTLSSVDDLIDCTSRSIDCSIEGIARSAVPRGHEVLHHHGLEDVIDRYPCVHPECGDGLIDPGEECDPLFDPDLTCSASCTLVTCGDGAQEGNEECDDGNTEDNDGCSAICEDEPFVCGNGIVEHFAGEVCDDSDSAAGDGCNDDCRSNETCGNGVVDTIHGETCDDGATSYVATLDGAQEVPPVVTAASGSATLTLNPNNTLTYNVTSTGLTATMAHIHLGAVGVDGPIVILLDGGPTAWSGTTPALNSEQRAQLKAGLLYINVHTAANTGGEIRGQILFAPTADGDGCSADCKSNETCGNGVIDAVTGEACDDGNVAPGDGCDASCEFEACSFFNSGTALGTRSFTTLPSGSGFWNSILGFAIKLGNIPPVTLPLTATDTDATGTAVVTLDNDVIVTINIPLGSQVQCLKFEAAGSSGTLHCCGGHAVDAINTRDSNTGGLPTTGGQSNGPAVKLGGIGTGGVGDLLMAFSVRESGGGTGFNCSTATYGPPSLQYWTTGSAIGRVLRTAQEEGTLDFGDSGAPFSCSAWTTTDGPGTFVSADTALNAQPGQDAANVRKLDD